MNHQYEVNKELIGKITDTLIDHPEGIDYYDLMDKLKGAYPPEVNRKLIILALNNQIVLSNGKVKLFIDGKKYIYLIVMMVIEKDRTVHTSSEIASSIPLKNMDDINEVCETIKKDNGLEEGDNHVVLNVVLLGTE